MSSCGLEEEQTVISKEEMGNARATSSQLQLVKGIILNSLLYTGAKSFSDYKEQIRGERVPLSQATGGSKLFQEFPIEAHRIHH